MFLHQGSLVDALLDSLFPCGCMGCGGAVKANEGFCLDCRERLVRATDRRLGALPLEVPYRYETTIAQAIVRLKYEDRPEFAKRLVRVCLPPLPPQAYAQATLVPVPMHPDRVCSRGYNQAALIACALGRRWKQQVRCHWLVRRKNGSRQVGLGRDERAENIRGVFAVRKPLERRQVVLVDDVVTTGATLHACAAALAEAGAVVVGAVALARAE